MRIKRVEIIGFKSFCDRAVVQIGESITGVVGPNGCGKSNIVDAIRWCMGEQSAKHLRGKAMEDVIFAGSESRGPAPMAEVSLTFDDVGFSAETLELARTSDEASAEQALESLVPEDEATSTAQWTDAEGNPIASPLEEAAAVLADQPPAFDFARYTEVTITRRLYRDGLSQYFINKTPCRLRDITDFFLGTGVGTKAYAIIEQGRIGQIVSSRPQDRRAIIEEAAGITKFKAKKKAAEKKLDQTRQNLMRVSDIVTELDKRMGTLRRQAQKAERYRKYKTEVKDIELWKFAHRWLELAGEGRLVSERLVEARTERETTQTSWVTKDAHVVTERAELALEERRLLGIQEQVYELENRLRLGESKIGFERREAEELETRMGVARTETESIAAQRAQGAAELATRESELASLEDEVARESAEVATREATATEARQMLSNTQGRLDEARSEIGARRTEIASADSHLESLSRRRDEAARRLERVMTDTEQHQSRAKELERESRRVDSSLSQLRQTRLDLGSQSNDFETRRAQLASETSTNESVVDTLRSELQRRTSRLSSLREIQDRYEGFDRGTRAVMQHADRITRDLDITRDVAMQSIDEDAIRGIVADIVRAPEHLEVAVEAALGDRLGGILVQNPKVGLAAVGFLKQTSAGRSAFVSLEQPPAPRVAPPPPPPIRAIDDAVPELIPPGGTGISGYTPSAHISQPVAFEGEGGASSWISPAWEPSSSTNPSAPAAMRRSSSVPSTEVPTPVPDGPMADAPMADAPVADASVADASMADASMADASMADASMADASMADASMADASMADASMADASMASMADAPVIESLAVDQAARGRSSMLGFTSEAWSGDASAAPSAHDAPVFTAESLLGDGSDDVSDVESDAAHADASPVDASSVDASYKSAPNQVVEASSVDDLWGAGNQDSVDASSVDASSVDASSVDASSVDASAVDASLVDASSVDASSVDASSVDASSVDASSVDASSVDASSVDASSVDASSVDTSSVDASSVDASSVDASSVDASSVDGSAVDGSAVDGSAVDASAVDASAVDASAVDASTVDASAVDASAVDASAVDASAVDASAFDAAHFDQADAVPVDENDVLISARVSVPVISTGDLAASAPLMVPSHELEGVIGRLSDLVAFADGYAEIGKRLLAKTLVVDDLARAIELHRRGVTERLVTLDGDIVDEDGIVAGGSRDARGAGVLAQKREIRDLEEMVGRLEHELSDATAKLLSSKNELAQVTKAIEGLRKQVHEGEIAITGHEKDEARVRSELERHREQLGRLGTEQLELEERLRVIGADEQANRDKRSGAIARIEELERAQLDLLSDVTTHRERLEDLANMLTEARIRAAQLGEKRAAAEAATLRLQRTDAELSVRAERLAEEIEGASRRAATLREGCDQLAAELAAVREQRDTEVQVLDEGRTGYQQRLSGLTEVEMAARELRTRADRLGTEVNQLELRDGQVRMTRQVVEDQVCERYQIEVPSVLSDYHLRAAVSDVEENRLTELRELIDRMGTDINLTAIEEYAEVSTRFEFLSAQKTDLERAVDQLQRAIDKINRTSRKLFKDTFDAVNATFKEVYPRLFRGGQASLSLTMGPERGGANANAAGGGDGGEGGAGGAGGGSNAKNIDLLEAGIEIMAQPPGKKNTTVDQLSGGEKALTAVALVFSIFLIKPSPFCILDEVDAPLDEANVDRYNELVREMTDRSQFIVITHNKRTMEAADNLYGVTMQEPGVSKLVSVNLSKLGGSKNDVSSLAGSGGNGAANQKTVAV